MSESPSRSRSLAVALAGRVARLGDPLRQAFLILLAVAVLAGQLSAAWPIAWTWPVWLPVAAVVLGLGGLVWGTCGWRPAVLLGLLCAAVVIGRGAVQRVHAPNFPADHLRQLSLPQKVTLEGWLYAEPERQPDQGRLRLRVERLLRSDASVAATGNVLVTVRHMAGDWRYGDRLRLTVRLRTPRNFHNPGGFDYEGYLARRGIYVTAFLWNDDKVARIGTRGSWLRQRMEHVRRTVGAFFDQHLAATPAGVLRALIIGDKSRLDPELRTAFQRVGAAHVLAISGLHVGIVAAVAYAVCWWLLARSRYVLIAWSVPKLAAAGSLPLVLLYAGLAGGRVSTWRAVVMVCVFLTAVLLDQRNEMFRSLALAALLISTLWPGAVFDASFQLSFMAVLGILLGLRRFHDRRDTRGESEAAGQRTGLQRLGRWARTYGVVSLSAMAGSLPLVAAHFHIVSLTGLLANLLVVPLLGSGVVVLGLTAATLLFVHSGAAALVVWPAGWIVHVAVWLVERLAAWPYAALHVVTPTALELVLLYGLGGCLLFAAAIRPPGLRTFLLAGLCGALCLDAAYWIAQRHFRSELRVSFLDVGQGDAAVVELPGSHVMVVDGGGFSSRTFDSGRAIVAPFLWRNKIGRVDTLVLTHPDYDHYGGLTFLADHFGVRSFWYTGEQSDSPRFERLLAALRAHGVHTQVLCRDTPDYVIRGVRIQVLHPPCGTRRLDTNNASLVLRLSHGEVDVLLTGDIETAAENMLLSTPAALGSEILKVPHHGSRSSSSLAFIEAVAPRVAVASLGHNNRFRFPAADVVARYERRGTRFLRTDRAGAVTVSSDGRDVRVETVLPETPPSS